MKIKYILSLFSIIISIARMNAQYLWHEAHSDTYHIDYREAIRGELITEDVIKPDVDDLNTNVSLFNKEEGVGSFADFDLRVPITDLTNYSITIRAYIDIPTEDLVGTIPRLRVYLANSVVGSAFNEQLEFTKGQEWETFTFDLSENIIPQDVVDANGYDEIRIGFANGNTSIPAMTYYIDTIKGTTSQDIRPAAFLQGSWGATFPVFGGERLDKEIADTGHDVVAGAQELVDELPAVGHIITNLSYFANSHYFPMSRNSNVDVANEIHPAVVPSAANDELIFDVLDIFKAADKKIILYISTSLFVRAEADNEDIDTAWKAYYNTKFAGDEYAAYENLIEGFLEEVKDYADGYWLDTNGVLSDLGKLEEFNAMIRRVDPTAAISTNHQKNYFDDENGDDILVESDGIDDVDDSQYKVVLHEPLNDLQDFSNGHVTPLGRGAPPNSFAYEEFTIPNMVNEPWYDFEGKLVLKHAWFPVRTAWHSPTRPLVFEIEQAYRFVRTITDSNAAITLANTTEANGSNAGHITAGEMIFMKEINNRLLMNPVPDYEPYVRPEGARYVGEILSFNSLNKSSDIKFYPNPVVDKLSISRTSTDTNYIEVISVIGVKVLEDIWNDGTLQTELDLSNLGTGIYFINLSNGKDYNTTRKIMLFK